LKAKIKEDAESQFATQADQNLGDVTEFFIEAQNSICSRVS
jgi:trigger factor